MIDKTGPRKKAITKRDTNPRTAKLDLYVKHKREYVAGRLPAFVRVGPARYLAISGHGVAGGEEFQKALGALYMMAFTIKMARKFAGRDYAVSKLEGLWWPDEGDTTKPGPRKLWNWQLMIRVPTFINEKELKSTIDQLLAKGKDPEVGRVKLAEYTEGECVQMLHVGPYSTEEETVGKMREFAAMAGRQFSGKHHEIYLSDPRRVAPEKLKTILRIPIS